LPSPIVHSAAGLLVYRLAREQLKTLGSRRLGPFPLVMSIPLLFSLLPDLDAIPGLLAGNLGQFHNNGTHSLVVGLGIALISAGVISWRWRSGFLTWFLILFSSYALHVGLDYVTFGERGVMLLWPLTGRRFDSGLTFFYGVRWSEGLWSVQHAITILTELAFVIPAAGLVKWIEGRIARPVQT
jgi:inner membrane protein